MMRLRCLPACSFLALALLGAAPVFAAAKGPNDAQAREEFRKAQAAYNLGDFEEARRAYSEVYRLKPHPALLFNIAQCERQLGNWDKAVFAYRRFIELAPEGTDVSTAEALLQEMQKKSDEQKAEEARLAEQARQKEEAEAIARAEAETKAKLEKQMLEPQVMGGPPGSEAVKPSPFYKKWWFWTGVGAAVVGGTVIAIAASSSTEPRPVSLGVVDTR